MYTPARVQTRLTICSCMEEKGFRGTGHETKALVRCLFTWRNTKRMASEEVILEEVWSDVHTKGNRKNKAYKMWS